MAPEPSVTLRVLGEDALIQRLCASLFTGADVLSGPGDDCAVLRSDQPGIFRLLKTDCVVEGVHFLASTEPHRIGWKAAARAVSDFAAMGGGQPREALITLIVSPERSVAWVEEVYRGLRRCADHFGFVIVGGETSRPPAGCDLAVISVSLSGTIAESACRLRSGARPANGVWVTGRLGRSFPTEKHLDFVPRMEEARWLVDRLGVTAMMDLSDGVARDLSRLAERSGVGYRIDETALPRTAGATVAEALADGEDYELLLTLELEPDAAARGEWAQRFPGLELTRIGDIVPLSTGDRERAGGWDAFQTAS
jgi:thiamine-monophosphate kinase